MFKITTPITVTTIITIITLIMMMITTMMRIIAMFSRVQIEKLYYILAMMILRCQIIRKITLTAITIAINTVIKTMSIIIVTVPTLITTMIIIMTTIMSFFGETTYCSFFFHVVCSSF